MPMDFSEMLEELGRFQKRKRTNWNVKDQYIFLLPGSAIAAALIAKARVKLSRVKVELATLGLPHG